VNILLLEDRGESEINVKKWLQQELHEVFDAFNPADAQSIWDDPTIEGIDCIILDLSMPADGLTTAQKDQTMGGVLCGWVWLKDSVLETTPEMKNRTIIYSDYIDIFKKNVSQKEYAGIAMFPKRHRGGSAANVAERVRQIDALPRK
jgi:CheY-like chemotaxis protein